MDNEVVAEDGESGGLLDVFEVLVLTAERPRVHIAPFGSSHFSKTIPSEEVEKRTEISNHRFRQS